MAIIILIVILIVMVTALVLLIFFNIARKIQMDIREKQNQKNEKNVKVWIEGFLTGPEWQFLDGLGQFIKHARQRGRNYLAIVDEYLLDALDVPEPENRNRLIAIARRLDFPAECRAQIRSRNPVVSAFGSRRAGLYNAAETVNDMVDALENLSSENQFEILMALARIGKADALERAFGKISNSVIINERAVMEILSTFPGSEEKTALFRNMLHSDVSYLAVLFLKAIDREIAMSLMADIMDLLRDDNKEVRAAAVRGLATMGCEAPAEELILALRDTDWEVRSQAAKALGPVDIPDTGTALFKALFDREWWVRQNAANALIKHSDYEALFVTAAQSGDKFTRDSIIAALENGGNRILLLSIRNIAA